MTARSIVMMLLLAPGLARADATDDARNLYLAGRQAYKDGRLDVAAESLASAYKLAPLPIMLYDLGKVYRKRYVVDGDVRVLRKSVEAYRAYLKAAPDGDKRADATQALDELVPTLGRLDPEGRTAVDGAPDKDAARKTELMVVTEAPGARVALDGKAPAPAPLLAEVAPGPHRAVVAAPGFFDGEVNATAIAGRLVVGEARLAPRPGRIDVAGRRGADLYLDGRSVGSLPHDPLDVVAGRHVVAVLDRGYAPWTGDLTVERGAVRHVDAALAPTGQRRAVRWMLGATAVAAVAAVACGAVWWQADDAASSILQRSMTSQIGAADLAAYDDDRSRRDAWRAATWAAIGVTGALALVTAGLYVFDRPSPPSPVAPAPVDPGQAALP